MSIAVVLAVVSGGAQDGLVLDGAAALAIRLQAHIRVLNVVPDVSRMLFFTGAETAIATAEIVSIDQRDVDAMACHARRTFDAWYPAVGLKVASMPFGCRRAATAEWVEGVGDATVLAEAAQLADVIVLAAPRGADRDLFETVLFESGRPVLVVPPRKLPSDLFAHTLVGWKPGREAARTIATSLPLLVSSRRVSVFSAPESAHAPTPSVGVIPYLAWHSINAELTALGLEEGTVGEKLLEAADRERASLIVLGAYGHSRVREFVLGGVTRHVLRHARLPVLMAH
jgi:nucleotide-binding universal stress UspA family protein